ncbi:hypothetical protein Psi02_64370 [Planotetraspora silvatica]|uniref:Alpha/beta hydrolase n=1 Tax=Planotetraspora silvatica TaxID=234614 RepID=A0A8J3XUZ0_9ACTN|nr:hypothetical protein [Planotetraspora silvatica]GII50013.1 hypothetical protein Psi02_64370 [Planotetraspora silvatica]
MRPSRLRPTGSPRNITILWPDSDPLFPPEWSDTLDDYYSDYSLHVMKNVGHFSPLEAPETWATYVLEHVAAAAKE